MIPSQAVAIKSTGQVSPPSNEDMLTTPGNAPILTSAEAWGPTTGQATATPPAGVTYTRVSHRFVLLRWLLLDELSVMLTVLRNTLIIPSCEFLFQSTALLQYTFTATPVGGGTPVVVTSSDPDVRFYGLSPATEASTCSV